MSYLLPDLECFLPWYLVPLFLYNGNFFKEKIVLFYLLFLKFKNNNFFFPIYAITSNLIMH